VTLFVFPIPLCFYFLAIVAVGSAFVYIFEMFLDKNV